MALSLGATLKACGYQIQSGPRLQLLSGTKVKQNDFTLAGKKEQLSPATEIFEMEPALYLIRPSY